MNEEIFKDILPDEYLKRHFVNTVRVDGRNFDEIRKPLFQLQNQTKEEESYGVYRQGGNLLFVKQTINLQEISETYQQRSTKYPTEVNVDLQSGQQNIQEKQRLEAFYARYVENFIAKNMAKLPSLLKVDSFKVPSQWTITLKVHVINQDGALLSSIFNAIQFSLLSTRLPTIVSPEQQSKKDETTIEIEKTSPKKAPVVDQKVRQRIGLTKEDIYYAVGVSNYFESTYNIVDPNQYEETNCDCNLLLVASLHNNSSNGSGEGEINFEQILNLEQKLEQYKKFFIEAVQSIE